jgi:CheY-like chemotaxis protein
LCSGSVLQQREEELREAGVDAVLQKPFMLTDLERAINKALNSRGNG